MEICQIEEGWNSKSAEGYHLRFSSFVSTLCRSLPPRISSPLHMRQVGDTDDHELCRGIKVTRPYSGVVWTARGVGWILMIAGTAEVIIGALLFRGPFKALHFATLACSEGTLWAHLHPRHVYMRSNAGIFGK